MIANNKKINEVYETTDYWQFKISDLNRDIKEQSVRKLAKSIKISGQKQPILVDEDFCVYDGQHRLSACELLKIPVKFIVDGNLKDEAIQAINANQNQWTIMNHVGFFSKQGLRDYQQLMELKESSPINISLLAAILLGRKDGGSVSEILKSGQFKIKNYEVVKLFLEDLKRLKKVCPSGNKTIDAFVYACWELWNTNKFDIERFMLKNKDLPEQAKGVRDTNVIMGYILENYNKGFKNDSSNKVRFFYDDKKNIVLKEKGRLIYKKA